MSSTSTPACCPTGSWPQLLLNCNADLNKDDIHPKGKTINIAVNGQDDLPLYFVEPASTKPCKGSILVIPDIYSVRALLPNVRSGDRIGSICDALAEEGYAVALAGIFRDKPYDEAVKGPEDGDFCKFDSFAQDGGVDWFKKQGYDKMGPAVQAAAKYLQEKNTTNAPLGVLGFCYGTWLLSKASSTGDVDFDCAVGCHPATVLEKAVFGGDEDQMLNDLKQPTLFLWAGNDSDIYTKDDGSGKVALKKTGGDVEEFSDQLHGWVSRGDVADDTVKAGVEKALKSITDFFSKNMTTN
jgi:dienelactone hydrolase